MNRSKLGGNSRLLVSEFACTPIKKNNLQVISHSFKGETQFLRIKSNNLTRDLNLNLSTCTVGSHPPVDRYLLNCLYNRVCYCRS